MYEIEKNNFVKLIMKSKKYQAICPDTVLDIINQEIQNHGNFKKAVPFAKERLHRLWAEFLGVPNYKKLSSELDSAFKLNNEHLVSDICLEVLKTHASTNERINIMTEEGYYQKIFDITGVPAKIADFACALNPFSFKWMSLDNNIEYFAYDINKDFIDFISFYFQLEGISINHIHWQDIYVNTPTEVFDIVFLFKMYHCLEHRKRGSALDLLNRIQAKWIAVSFPSQNLQGKKQDIYGNYSEKIVQLCTEKGWSLHKLTFSNEVLILIHKQ